MVYDKKALLIGINYANTPAALRGCINDCKNMINFLKSDYGFIDEEIKFLNDNDFNNLPTAKNIIEGFIWLQNEIAQNSKLFLHFSGHGYYMKDNNGDEHDGYDEFICPIDYNTAGLISDDQIRKYLIDNLGDCKLTCLFDCCHSGTVLDLKYNLSFVDKITGKEFLIREDPKYLETNASVVFISGCKDNQTSADAYINGKYQGAMTFCFLKTIERFKLQKKDISYHSLIESINNYIKAGKFSQIPLIAFGKQENIFDKFTIL